MPNPQNTPPLGGRMCPDPRWNGGRALILQGPNAFLGARWVLTASMLGQPAHAPIVPPTPLPVEQGGIPFVDVVLGNLYNAPDEPEAAEGSTAYAEEED